MATVLKQTGIHRIRVLSAILLIALAGCASDAHRKMYAGEPVPLDQRAFLHIVGKKEGFNNVFIISIIDNERTITFFDRLYYPFAGASSVDVLPGRHTVVLSTRYDEKISLAERWFVAEPGRSYAAIAEDKGDGVHFRTEDEVLGQPVGGVLREFSESRFPATGQSRKADTL